jgi:hypothetical protein
MTGQWHQDELALVKHCKGFCQVRKLKGEISSIKQCHEKILDCIIASFSAKNRRLFRSWSFKVDYSTKISDCTM